MPKLVLVAEGKVLAEWSLNAEEAVIGRDGDCEVRIDDPSVSRHHARVARIFAGYVIEDLNSTNGVNLNGRRVRKHMLRNGDVVQVGTHELRFDAEEGAAADAGDLDKTVVLTARAPIRESRRQRIAAPPPSERVGGAYVRYLTGPEHGDSRLIDKSLFTIGEPGGNLAVISRRAQGYFLLHLGGEVVTTLNRREVHGAGVKLSSGDRITVGDTELEFYTE
jgi:pSer/pThr/pTyr-binding forkhead associated (FHA) protein